MTDLPEMYEHLNMEQQFEIAKTRDMLENIQIHDLKRLYLALLGHHMSYQNVVRDTLRMRHHG